MNNDPPIVPQDDMACDRPHFTMAELLAKSDYSLCQPRDERAWVDAPATGREPL